MPFQRPRLKQSLHQHSPYDESRAAQTMRSMRQKLKYSVRWWKKAMKREALPRLDCARFRSTGERCSRCLVFNRTLYTYAPFASDVMLMTIPTFSLYCDVFGMSFQTHSFWITVLSNIPTQTWEDLANRYGTDTAYSQYEEICKELVGRW